MLEETINREITKTYYDNGQLKSLVGETDEKIKFYDNKIDWINKEIIIRKEWYSNGKLKHIKSKNHFQSSVYEIYKSFTDKYYYPSGILKSKTNEHFTEIGLYHKEYYENGNLKFIHDYNEFGCSEEWYDKSGKLISYEEYFNKI